MAHTGATRGGSGAMREYVKFEFDSAAPLQETSPTTSATPATPQEQSSESSTSSTEVSPFSHYCTPEERVQGRADGERGDRHEGDRGLSSWTKIFMSITVSVLMVPYINRVSAG